MTKNERRYMEVRLMSQGIPEAVFEVVDFEKIFKSILKNDAMINPIVDLFRMKEELKSRSELTKTKRLKIKSDKYIPSIGEKNWLCLSEGQSAVASISTILGRNGFAFYALRGLPINAWSAFCLVCKSPPAIPAASTTRSSRTAAACLCAWPFAFPIPMKSVCPISA